MATPTSRQAFPTRQMTILAICRICEPIAFMSIFPYVYFMIKDFDITNAESRIAVYAGLVTSAFALAEFSAAVPWGRASDRIGRKPVIICGLAGTALSMIMFGFASNLPVALAARALGGLLNGCVFLEADLRDLFVDILSSNIGVIQTTVAEMVPCKEHQPRAYSIMPFIWSLGSIIGPVIGGGLARPVAYFPHLFTPGSIWDRYPYLLANLVCFVIVALGVIFGLLFLEETHPERKLHRDPCLEFGKWITAGFRHPSQSPSDDGCDSFEETAPLLVKEQPVSYATVDIPSERPSTPRSIDTDTSATLSVDTAQAPSKTTYSAISTRAVVGAFNRNVVLNIVGYFVLAYHTISDNAMFPTFLSTPEPRGVQQRHLPFQFVGGFGLNTQRIGFILAVQAVYAMFLTIFIFPIVARRMGVLQLFRLIAICWPLFYFITPYTALLPHRLQIPGIYALGFVRSAMHTFAYPANAILLTNAAPSLLVLGTINGVAASSASLARAFGPTLAGLLYSVGLSTGCVGLLWWVNALVAVLGIGLAFALGDAGGRMDEVESPGSSTPTGTEDLEALSAERALMVNGVDNELIGATE